MPAADPLFKKKIGPGCREMRFPRQNRTLLLSVTPLVTGFLVQWYRYIRHIVDCCLVFRTLEQLALIYWSPKTRLCRLLPQRDTRLHRPECIDKLTMLLPIVIMVICMVSLPNKQYFLSEKMPSLLLQSRRQ